MPDAGSVTEILARIWGLGLVASGVGIFTSRARYGRMIGELREGVLTLYLSGLAAFIPGAVTLALHSDWSTAPAIVISLLAWLALIEGVVLMAAPRLYLALIGRIRPEGRLLPAMALLGIVAGLWLLAVGFNVL